MHLRQRAEEILSLVDQTESEMNNYEQEYTGNIRIGAAETQNVKFLTDTFALLHMEHPGITIELFSGNADAVQDRLEHGLIDFALLLEPVSLEKFDFIRLPNPDRLGIVTDVNSPWGHLTEVHPEDLRDMPLLRTSRASSKSYNLSKYNNYNKKNLSMQIFIFVTMRYYMHILHYII